MRVSVREINIFYMTYITIAGGELCYLIIIFDGIEDVAEELFRNASNVVQTHILGLLVIGLQLLQHLLGVGGVGRVWLKVLERISVGLHHKVLGVGVEDVSQGHDVIERGIGERLFLLRVQPHLA